MNEGEEDVMGEKKLKMKRNVVLEGQLMEKDGKKRKQKKAAANLLPDQLREREQRGVCHG